MQTRYRNRYRTDSIRLQTWDYGWNAAYFITICTHNRDACFGAVENNKMILSSLGIIADILWYEIKNHANNVELSEFVVMPNHIHGILILNDNTDTNANIDENRGIGVGDCDGNDDGNGDGDIVETRHALSLPQPQPPTTTTTQQTIGQHRFQNQGKNTISSIIGSYKSAVSKHAHRLGFVFKWQQNYWEHIVRSGDELHRIAKYIIENPVKWENDKLNGGKGNSVMEQQSEYNAESWMV